ncbi:hypothetical protein C8R43DRAFT_1024410 [Mycena crocata]|nr:hypothetical protein C8R43DRAFT_1024410 [Mycena crocata]
MLTLTVTFHVQPQLTCLFFDVLSDPSKPGRFRLIELWSKDRAWFEKEQLTKPYYAELWAKRRPTRPTWERELELEYFERLGEGASMKKDFAEEVMAGR